MNSNYNHAIGGSHWAPPTTTEDVIHISDDEAHQSHGMMGSRGRPTNYYNSSPMNSSFGRTNYSPNYHTPSPAVQNHAPSGVDSVSSKLEDKFLGFQPLMSPSASPHTFPPMPFGTNRPPPPSMERSPHHSMHFPLHSPIGGSMTSHSRPSHDYSHPPYTPSRAREYPYHQEDAYGTPVRPHVDYPEDRRRESTYYDHPPSSYSSAYNAPPAQYSRYDEPPTSSRGSTYPNSYGPPHNPFNQYPMPGGPPGDLLDELRSASNPMARPSTVQPHYGTANKARPTQMKGLAPDFVPEMSRRRNKKNGADGVASVATALKAQPKPKRLPAAKKQPQPRQPKPKIDQVENINGNVSGVKVKPARKSKVGPKTPKAAPPPRNQRKPTLRARSERKYTDYDDMNGDKEEEEQNEQYESYESSDSGTETAVYNAPLITRNSDNFCFASSAIHLLSETVEMVRQCKDYLESEVQVRSSSTDTKEVVKEEVDLLDDVKKEQIPITSEPLHTIVDLSVYNCVIFNEKHKQKKLDKILKPPPVEKKVRKTRKKTTEKRVPERVSSGIRKSKLRKGPGLDVYEVLCATQLSKVAPEELAAEALTEESAIILREAIAKQEENTLALLKADDKPELVPSVHYFLAQGNDVEIGTTANMTYKDRPSDHEGAMLKQLQDQLQDDGMGNRFNNMGDYIQQNISLRTRGLIYRLNTQRVNNEVLQLKRKDINTDLKTIFGGNTPTTDDTSPKSSTSASSQNGKRVLDDAFDYDDMYKRGRSRRRIDNELTVAPIVSPKRTSTRTRKEVKKGSDDEHQEAESSSSVNGDEEHVDSDDSDSANYNLRKRRPNSRRSARVQKRKIDDTKPEKQVPNKRKKEATPPPVQEKEDSNESIENSQQDEKKEEEQEQEQVSTPETTPVTEEAVSPPEVASPSGRESPSLSDAELLAGAARGYNTRGSERRLMTQIQQLDEKDPIVQHRSPNRRRISRINPKKEQRSPSPAVPEETPTTPETQNDSTMGEAYEHPKVDIVPTIPMTTVSNE